ncbi:uncharacterized protein LOC132544868 [Ylistrum balloti]|uniref:uncharacterized protein LOC132544868 n=1 Tax=Ylistrum balloti TaxID=509963 RepID=UPI0029058185|nr:uncharacterized protein LOC132544868 [Ylistrum balloti]
MGSTWSDSIKVEKVDRKVKSIWERRGYIARQEKTEIGSNFNCWRTPVSEFSSNESILRESFQQNEITKELWQKTCGVVDEIAKLFQQNVQRVSSLRYPCLSFGNFVKQGSSREGLKIRQPDEFDMVLPFTIKGIDIHTVPALDNDGEPIPALVNLQISDYGQIQNIINCTQYKSLNRDGVFEEHGAHLILSAMCFQTKVITSIMDTTISEIQKSIDARIMKERCSFNLSKASVYPPTYRFKILMKSVVHFDDLSYAKDLLTQLESRTPVWRQESKVIEFDIVPALLLQSDRVPNPDSWCSMKCERYAVMKWVHKERYADDYPDPNLLWKESTCGYEKHIIDVSCRKRDFRYIITACRIMKAYLDGSSNSSQLSSLLSTYHLKNIAIHCILLRLRVSGVKEALGYFMAFLEISLQEEFLPHFFYGNPHICTMFPNLSSNATQKRLNLFNNIPQDHFHQAFLSFRRMQKDLRGLVTEYCYLNSQQCFESFRELCCLYGERSTSMCMVM